MAIGYEEWYSKWYTNWLVDVVRIIKYCQLMAIVGSPFIIMMIGSEWLSAAIDGH